MSRKQCLPKEGATGSENRVSTQANVREVNVKRGGRSQCRRPPTRYVNITERVEGVAA